MPLVHLGSTGRPVADRLRRSNLAAPQPVTERWHHAGRGAAQSSEGRCAVRAPGSTS